MLETELLETRMLETMPLKLGQRPPEFALTDSAGRRVELHSLLGKNRLLIAFSPTSSDLELVKREAVRFLERDLLLLAIDTAKPATSAAPIIGLRDSDGSVTKVYGSSGATLVYLVGKDGTVKAIWSRVPKLSDVYALIDAMPMRRAGQR